VNIHPALRRRAAATVVALLALPAVARAQGVAAVVEISGEVVIEDAAGGTRRLAAVPDTARVVNGALASGDELRTGPDGSATVRFADGAVFRAGAATRAGVVETAVPVEPGASRVVRRAIRLGAGRVQFDSPASETVLTDIVSASGRVSLLGVQGIAAMTDGRLRVAVDSGRATITDASGSLTAPLGIGQSIDLQADGGALVVRVPSDGGRPIRSVIRAVRVDLTAGAAIRIAPGADGSLAVTVLASPVQVTRGEAAASRSVQVGETFPATAGGIDIPEPKPRPESEKPAPPPVRTATADRRTPAEVPIPPLPEVRSVDDTIEASPTK
jgi:hypothetical protein